MKKDMVHIHVVLKEEHYRVCVNLGGRYLWDLVKQLRKKYMLKLLLTF